MNIIITGSEGFIGKNLTQRLLYEDKYKVFEITRKTSLDKKEQFLKKADFIFHLAGVNRSDKKDDFKEGNQNFLKDMIQLLDKHKNYPPILFTSSIQVERQTLYGQSKKAAELLIKEYSKKYNTACYIYQLPNVFGKWSKPYYNSVVATFCYNIAREKEIKIIDPERILTLVYIDDVVNDFIHTLTIKNRKFNLYYSISKVTEIKLKKLAQIIQNFHEQRKKGWIPNFSNSFVKKLYSTYLSFLSMNELNTRLIEHKDERGSFTEFIKSNAGGQVSINISKPGITKGDHWHHTKVEKFLVVKGSGIIYLRDLYSKEIYQYKVSDQVLEVIDIPAGMVHSIENIGENEMITVMWVNEPFNPERPDTYYSEV